MSHSDPFALFPFHAIVDRPPVAWPNGARVAVWVVPNIEHFHVEIGPGAPDIRNHSRRDYGNRVGVWRLMEVLEKNGVRGTVALNGEVGTYYPRIMEAVIAARLGADGPRAHQLGHAARPVAGAGDRRDRRDPQDHRGLRRQDARLARPGPDRDHATLDLLRANGVEYVADWVNDDLPYRMTNGLYSIPYSIELNDMPLFNMPSIGIEEFYRKICETFDVLYDEGARPAAA